MGQRLNHRSINEFAAMSVEDAGSLLAAACELKGAAQAGMNRHVLRGKNLALLCHSAGDANGTAALTFRRAASGLGAQVAQLRSSLSELSTPDQVQHTARMLGRLYDGIECLGLPPELVKRIGAAAGVPVFEAISSGEHPTSRLASQLAGPLEADANRCTVMQAVLIAALA